MRDYSGLIHRFHTIRDRTLHRIQDWGERVESDSWCRGDPTSTPKHAQGPNFWSSALALRKASRTCLQSQPRCSCTPSPWDSRCKLCSLRFHTKMVSESKPFQSIQPPDQALDPPLTRRMAPPQQVLHTGPTARPDGGRGAGEPG